MTFLRDDTPPRAWCLKSPRISSNLWCLIHRHDQIRGVVLFAMLEHFGGCACTFRNCHLSSLPFLLIITPITRNITTTTGRVHVIATKATAQATKTTTTISIKRKKQKEKNNQQTTNTIFCHNHNGDQEIGK